MMRSLAWAIALGMVGGPAGVAAAAEGPRFEVTVTNLTAGQLFTPVLVASHGAGVRLFDPGEPASLELEALAEAGDTGPLAVRLSGMPEVLDVAGSGEPVPPGESVTISVRSAGRSDRVSVAAMLVPTNDAFFALDGVAGPGGNGASTFLSPAYDAGTEPNDESCAHVPGPPAVCQGEGFNPDRTGDVDFVHIHRGIHGVGDLPAEVYDWRNPVARITIRRVP